LIIDVDHRNGRVPIAHVYTHRPVLRVFSLDHQSDNFILSQSAT